MKRVALAEVTKHYTYSLTSLKNTFLKKYSSPISTTGQFCTIFTERCDISRLSYYFSRILVLLVLEMILTFFFN